MPKCRVSTDFRALPNFWNHHCRLIWSMLKGDASHTMSTPSHHRKSVAPRSASLAAAICCRRSCASWWRNSCRVWSRGKYDQWKIPYFNGKIYGFRLRISQLNQSIDHEEATVFWDDLPIFKTRIIPKSMDLLHALEILAPIGERKNKSSEVLC